MNEYLAEFIWTADVNFNGRCGIYDSNGHPASDNKFESTGNIGRFTT